MHHWFAKPIRQGQGAEGSDSQVYQVRVNVMKSRNQKNLAAQAQHIISIKSGLMYWVDHESVECGTIAEMMKFDLIFILEDDRKESQDAPKPGAA